MSDGEKHALLSDLIQKPIRLRKSLIKEIDEIRDSRGQTFQTFVQAAIMKAVAEAKTEEASSKSRRSDDREKRKAPVGLGMRERLEEMMAPSTPDEGPETRQAAPQGVTVNVGGAASGAGGTSADIATLARMVVEGPRTDRRRLLESACKALAKSAKTSEESIALAEQLDAEIARLDVPTTALERVRARRKK